MENLILENSFATIKQTLLPSDDPRNKFYLVIHGDEENLNYKIVSEENLKGKFPQKRLNSRRGKYFI